MMKYVCLGYVDEKMRVNMIDSEQASLTIQQFYYVEELKRMGFFLSGEDLQDSQNTTTVRKQDGKISVTAGPHKHMKEQFGSFILIEAKDLNHAIRLISTHPSLQIGNTWEIRPVAHYQSKVTPRFPGKKY